MESNYVNNENGLQDHQLVLTLDSVSYLRQIAKWTTFFSIVGFVFIGIMVVFGLLMSTLMSTVFAMGNPVMPYMGFIYVVLAALYIMPVTYLYRFSTIAKKAINKNDSNDMMMAFRNLKSHLKFVGILTIVILCIYLVAGIGFAVVKLVM